MFPHCVFSVNGSSYDALKLLDSLDDLLTGVITAQEVCPNIQLTYGVYHVLAEGLVNMGRNVQNTLPSLLQQIDYTCCLPAKISNLTAKVKKIPI